MSDELRQLLERCREFVKDHDAPPPKYVTMVYIKPRTATEKAQDAVDAMRRECELRRDIDAALDTHDEDYKHAEPGCD